MANLELIQAAEGRCEGHRADHSFRVMKLGRKIFANQVKIDGPEEVRQNPDFFLNILDWTAVLHDREMSSTEVYDFDHGEKALKKVEEIVGNNINQLGKRYIKLLCFFHVPDDNEIEGELGSTLLWLLKVFKDADSLDRVRFENGDKLDERFLRFEISKELIPEAKRLWERTKYLFNNPQAAFDVVLGNRVE